MAKLANLNTSKSWVDSLTDLKAEFRKWSIPDYLLPVKQEAQRNREVAITFAVKGRWITVRCALWAYSINAPERQLRAIVMAIESARLADQRGIGGLLAEVTRHMALPSGKRHPLEILGLPVATSDQEVIRQAYIQRLKETHPDTGGNAGDFQAVRKAGEELKVEI